MRLRVSAPASFISCTVLLPASGVSGIAVPYRGAEAWPLLISDRAAHAKKVRHPGWIQGRERLRFREGGEIVMPGVEYRREAPCEHARQVRRSGMEMHVNEPGNYELTGGIDDLGSARNTDFGRGPNGSDATQWLYCSG
jgi:hypothetical protein